MSKTKSFTPTRDYLDSYEFHGMNFSRVGKEGISDCPYCGKEAHFFVDSTTGQHNCKVCNKTGNLYSFLQKIHGDAKRNTKKEDYEALSELRSRLPWSAFRQFKLAYDESNDRWLLPIYNGTGSLADVRVWTDLNGRKQLMTTAGCSTHLFNASALPTAPVNATVYICEGEWDAIALQWLFDKNEVPPSTYCIVAVPGAGTFKKEWIDQFKGRTVVLLYDNDTAGLSGMERTTGLLKPVVASLTSIHWPADADNFPEGYDIRDFVCDRIKTPKRALKDLLALVQHSQAFDPAAKPKKKLVRPTFASVIKDFNKVLHMTPNTRDALLVTMASAISVHLPGDNVWLFLVGPPGSGKSLSINAFNKVAEAVFLSKLTAQSLISGYRTGDGSDPSLLPQLNGKCLFVKDYTAIKGMPVSVQEELYGILRDAYDKHVRVIFGNGEVREYSDLSFSMVAGVTDVIHGDNRATLGERFLKFELLPFDYDPEDHIRAAIDNVVDLIQGEELLQESVEAFFSSKLAAIDYDKLPAVPEWVRERIIALTQVASYLRAVVHRGFGGDMIHRPRPEVGTRLGKQLIKLGRCLALILDKKTIDKDVYRIMEKVAVDTVVGWSLEMVRFLISYLQKNKQGAGVTEIAAALQVSTSFVGKKLNDLQELRIVESTPVHTGSKGRPSLVWSAHPKFLELWKRAKLDAGMETPRPRIRKRKPSTTTSTRKKVTATKRVRRKK